MKIYSFTAILCTLCLTILIISCGSDSKEKSKTATEVTKEVVKTVETPKATTTYFAWVDNINIRDASNTKGKVIGTFSSKDTLEFTGTKSDVKETIVLRGVAYDDYWLKITTKDNKKGWVYGGAVVQEGNTKGNAIITKDIFDFPYFGAFNLTSWSDLAVTKSEGGDAETVTLRYMKDGKILEVEKTDVGEYGYYHTYRLMDAKSKLLKERSFSFTVDMGENDSTMELKETVKDFSTNTQYTRKQSIDKHFMELNARPQMANGTWLLEKNFSREQ